MSTHSAVLLAAGIGSRISAIASDPKILLPLGGHSLLHRHFEAFEMAGIKSVIVVVGYRDEKIRSAAAAYPGALEIRFVVNEDYTRLGNGVSLWLGLAAARSAVVVLDGDLFYPPAMLQRFLAAPKADAALVGRGEVEDIESAKTLVDDDNHVRKFVDKRALDDAERAAYRFAGEATGILKFSDTCRHALLATCERFFAIEENLPLNWEHLLTGFLLEHDLWCHYEPADGWIEIDTPEDYAAAQLLV